MRSKLRRLEVPPETAIAKIEQAVAALEVADIKVQREASEALTWLQAESRRIGLRQLAASLNIDAGHLSPVLNGERAPSTQMIHRARLGSKLINPHSPDE